MATFSNTGSIDRGLIFCFDARNTKSYSGSGNTFLDIGGNLTSNSATFASYNSSPGYISFDGTNGSGIQFPSRFQEGGAIQWRQNYTGGVGITNLSTTTSSYMSTGVWYQVVATLTPGSRKLYINGSLVNSDTYSGTLATGQAGIGLGSFGGGQSGYSFNGDLAIVKAYNVELTVAEVLTNFNSLRGRFGI